jgi:hypothetical protein
MRDNLGCLGLLVVFVIILAISFLINAVLFAVLCWGLKAIGIFTIGSWTVAFSWKAVLIFSVVLAVLKSVFSSTVTVNK